MIKRKATAVCLLATAFTMFGVSAATLTDYNYVPTEGESPYSWDTLANWQLKDGTTPAALPDAESWPKFPAALADATVVIPGSISPTVGGITVAASNMRLEIEEGATLSFAHSSTYFGDSASGCELRVKKGGTLNLNNFFRLSTGTKPFGNRIVIDEGGSFMCGGNPFYVGDCSTGDAMLVNYGSALVQGNVFAGYRESKPASSVVGVIDNHATLTTSDSNSKSIFLGGQSGGTGILTNRVGATAKITLSMTLGACSNAIGRIVNEGSFSCSKTFNMGGNDVYCTNSTASLYPQGFFYNAPDASATLKGEVRLGAWTYGRATIDNYGEMTFSGSYVRMAFKDSHVKSTVENHTAGTMNFLGTLQVGYNGQATLISSGKLIMTNSAPHVGYHASGTGTLELRNSAHYVGRAKDLNVANSSDGATGNVIMNGNARMSRPGAILMASGLASKATFTMNDNAILDDPGVITVGIGRGTSTTKTWTQSAVFSMNGNSCITNLNEYLHIATNAYAKGRLELNDNSRIVFSNARGRQVRLGTSQVDSTNSWAELRLRGGTLVLATNSTVIVGKNSTEAPGCRGCIAGWGRIDRWNLEESGYQYGTTLTMFGGCLTADGEGEPHDLDLSLFRKVNDGGKNLSGTNGWYAINKGRLTYPCRNSDYRMLGDYYSRKGDPVYVNGVAFDFDSSKKGYLIGQLYATDRDDIPAGLPADSVAARTARLGVWRATVSKDYNLDKVSKANNNSFVKAAARIRYDNFRLAALADANVPMGDLHVNLYHHDGTAAGRWRKVTSLALSTAEANGHLIGGDLPRGDGDWNIGFFAVVVEPRHGTTVILR